MKTVLLAEDEMAQRLPLRRALSERGFAVIEADDGEAAVAALADCPPDIVLLDLTMPRMDGLAVLQHIRKAYGTLPVIILTNRRKDELPEKLSTLGVSAIFVKYETSLEKLDRTIRRCLGMREPDIADAES
jgi:DNA-binding response OmpR family regulator